MQVVLGGDTSNIGGGDICISTCKLSAQAFSVYSTQTLVSAIGVRVVMALPTLGIASYHVYVPVPLPLKSVRVAVLPKQIDIGAVTSILGSGVMGKSTAKLSEQPFSAYSTHTLAPAVAVMLVMGLPMLGIVSYQV